MAQVETEQLDRALQETEADEDQHGGNVRTAGFWLRKAIRARASADIYPQDRDELENIAEMHEQMAERVAELGNR